MEKIRIRDEKKVGSGIRDKHPGFKTLICTVQENARTIYTTPATVPYLGNPYSE
jgi:hypothetical protein